MDKIQIVRGIAAPLMIDSLDTDVITPMSRIMEGSGSLLQYSFEPLRFHTDGSLNPEFVLNQPAYANAKILITGANFACGSSRETAVWAVKGLGFDVVIASSFGEIFRQNAFKNGLLPIQLPDASVKHLARQANDSEFTVNLQTQQILAPDGSSTRFEVNGFRKAGLLAGQDDLTLVLAKADKIRDFQIRDRSLRPWVYNR
ncbi:MAG: 3-isopropylmalate dehydratase small subunit [Deltaproteobacteria bacterium]|nr:3-isopropylmalate dehydratase small subunit [Deltaproteobacteria bacterium]